MAAGARSAKGIVDALTYALPASHITKLKDAGSYTNFTASSALPTVVLFTDKPKTSALYKSLSLRFKGRLAFAEVSSKAAEVVEQQGVHAFPKLLVLKGDEVEEYSGEQLKNGFYASFWGLSILHQQKAAGGARHY